MSETGAGEAIDPAARPSGTGCVDCDQQTPQGWWFHLRRCAACGHVGCCDSSPAQHASGHYALTGHPVMQSFEPGEDWYWDFTNQRMSGGPELARPTAHPDDQPVPGPWDRVPADWMTRLRE